jgi:GTP-binding protein
MPKPYVAIVGRPNVGKSTLFNRLIGERRSVVSEIPGTTRDRVIGESEWNGRSFVVVDTGGIEILPETVESGRRPGPEEPLLEDSAQFIPLIRAQAELAIEEADLIVFVTDSDIGLTGADREVASLLRRSEKPVLLVANKADNEKREYQAMEFYELGLGQVYAVSAIHGIGVGDLLDEVVEQLPFVEEELEEEPDTVRLAIVGRPNVGKSSLLNRLLGQERSIVSPVAGTTRDAIDTLLEWEDQKFTLIDTAGIRRRGKIEPGVEKYSVLRTVKAVERADAALLVIDGVEGITAQDAHIAGIIAEAGVSTVVLVNKWDAVAPEAREKGLLFEALVKYGLKFMPYIPVLFISALTGLRVNRVLPTALEVVEARYQRIPTGPLNDVLREALAEHAPPSVRGRRLKLYYATQAEVAPPRFILFVNDPRLVHFTYERYLENQIREVFPFSGTPVRLTFRGHKRKKGKR